jgi:hypothetical protein
VLNTQIRKLYRKVSFLINLEHERKEKEKEKRMKEILINKMLLKICAEKLGEMDELEIGPVNVFFPRVATATVLSSCFHLKHCWRMKWFKDAIF